NLLVRLADANAAGRQEIFEQLAHTGDGRLEAVFADFNEGSLYVWKGHAVTCKKFESEGDVKVAPLVDPLTREPVLVEGRSARVPAAELKEIAPTRADRTMVRNVTSLLRLSNPNREARLAAVIKSGEGAV